MACPTSVKARFLKTTFALARSYSLVNASTILAFAAPLTTPTVLPFKLSMLSMDDPGRRDDQYDHMADDDDGLRLRQVADIAANHCEIHLTREETGGGLKRGAAVDDLEPDRLLR